MHTHGFNSEILDKIAAFNITEKFEFKKIFDKTLNAIFYTKIL